MSASSSISHRGRSLRITVVAVGLLVCLMLFFADKSNLHNQKDSALGTTSVPSSAQTTASGKIPPLAKDEKFDLWVAELEKAGATEKVTLLDSIVQLLVKRNRFEYAADYADQLAQQESSLKNRLQAGVLSQKASQLEYIQSDSLLFRQYSRQTISYLSAVVEENPDQEEALLYLGLGYIQSGLPENSMKGIMTLRSVVEKNPNHIEAGYYLGLFSLQTNQLEKAKERFETVLKNAPDYSPAKLQLAVTHIQMGQPALAKTLLEELLRGKEADDEIKLTARELINTLP
ncbi:MAG: tetratricopeptide repeat protein [Bacteroidia bacterium]|nr:tetratricopeptide repeat protein [Bacteroidia bacterium]